MFEGIEQIDWSDPGDDDPLDAYSRGPETRVCMDCGQPSLVRWIDDLQSEFFMPDRHAVDDPAAYCGRCRDRFKRRAVLDPDGWRVQTEMERIGGAGGRSIQKAKVRWGRWGVDRDGEPAG